jgi:ATP-binding cassette, subfamily C (CFTR/MRP), member 1
MGEITAVGLMGTDVERIAAGMQMVHEVWASLLDVGIATWLLGRQLNVACIAPIVIVVGSSDEQIRRGALLTYP